MQLTQLSMYLTWEFYCIYYHYKSLIPMNAAEINE